MMPPAPTAPRAPTGSTWPSWPTWPTASMAGLGAAAVIEPVVQQHVDDVLGLGGLRLQSVLAPRVGLSDLGRLDARLESHFEGLAIAGSAGDALLRQTCQFDAAADLFVAGVRALDSGDQGAFGALLAMAQARPSLAPGLAAAAGWVGAARLKGVTPAWFASRDPTLVSVALTACRWHRVEAGRLTDAVFEGKGPALRSMALRHLGDEAKAEGLDHCLAALTDEDPGCRFNGARSAILLGERRRGADCLRDQVMDAATDRERRQEAATLLMLALPVSEARSVLRALHAGPWHLRDLILAMGPCGDPALVPWLIEQMRVPDLARVAADAFSLIAGVNLEAEALAQRGPEDLAFGPTDDPDDDEVRMDPDDGLPWPDVARIETWWHLNRPNLKAGVRHLMGRPVSSEQCRAVLVRGRQHHRAIAALSLSLDVTGADLFPIAAPAWRQAAWLDGG